jgi:hypothetical protein
MGAVTLRLVIVCSASLWGRGTQIRAPRAPGGMPVTTAVYSKWKLRSSGAPAVPATVVEWEGWEEHAARSAMPRESGAIRESICGFLRFLTRWNRWTE